MTIRRITALVLAIALAWLPLDGGAQKCASQASISEMPGHAGMAMPAPGSDTQSASGCDACSQEPRQDAPCDHGPNHYGCASMISCAPAVAEVQDATPSFPWHSTALVTSAARAPYRVSTAPEPPPPRA